MSSVFDLFSIDGIVMKTHQCIQHSLNTTFGCLFSDGFERHVQMVVERAMFEVMGSVDRRMQRFMAKVNQRIEFLEQK